MTKFELHLSGSKIGEQRIPIDVMGKYLIALNDLLRDVAYAKEKVPKTMKKKNEFFNQRQLYLTGLTSGSTTCQIESDALGSMDNYLHGDEKLKIFSPVENLLIIVFEGIEIIQSIDEKEAFSHLQNLFPDPINRIHILNNYKRIWMIREVTLEFRKIKRFYSKKKVVIKHSYYNRVRKMLNEELKIETQTYSGIITRIKADGKRRYFTLLTGRYKTIECNLSKEDEHNVIGNFKSPVKIKGIISQIRTKTTIKEVLEINKIKSLEITPNDFAPLIFPIFVDIDYNPESELWTAVNEYYGIRASADNIEDLKEDCIDQLDSTVDLFIIQKNKKNITPKFAEIIENIKKIINVSKSNSENHWIME